jgi:uncharacterized protein YkwD
MIRRVSATAISLAAAASIAVAAVPGGALAASGHHRHHTQHSTVIRSFDSHLLDHANNSRTNHSTHAYRMSHKLWKVAHAWALHLAKTGTLEHNPKLESRISHKCPAWRNIGENVGVVYGKATNKQMFKAYMNSPEHRANILDKHYHQVGIASVKVVRHHHVQEWDVMDFGNHC